MLGSGFWVSLVKRLVVTNGILGFRFFGAWGLGFRVLHLGFSGFWFNVFLSSGFRYFGTEFRCNY